jgi:pimeloyl-ACP methyl ester carboxylesterase
MTMTHVDSSGMLQLGQMQLEYRMIGPRPSDGPTIVLLHEGLGSMALWRDFPDKLASATGVGVFVYSRPGYGASSPVSLPRPLTYMHDEAREVVPATLEAIGFRRGLFVGHSDGASVAALYLGGKEDHRVRGLSLIAPHFIVEDLTIAEIARLKVAYEKGGLKENLAAWHANVDISFRGWNEIWLDPQFRNWDISESLAYIRVPIQIIQGEADQYGTTRQIEIAQEECYCPVDVTLLPAIGHAPHREAPEATLKAVADFANHILWVHGEGSCAA